MLNPHAVVDSVVTALQSMDPLVEYMAGDVDNIAAYHYLFGQQLPFAEAIYKMPCPGILVAWRGTLPGQADGQTLFKHLVEVYIRMSNAAGSTSPKGYEDIWWTICNEPVNGGPVNIRYATLLAGLEIMDTPFVSMRIDEEGQDFAVGTLAIPELGDN